MVQIRQISVFRTRDVDHMETHFHIRVPDAALLDDAQARFMEKVSLAWKAAVADRRREQAERGRHD